MPRLCQAFCQALGCQNVGEPAPRDPREGESCLLSLFSPKLHKVCIVWGTLTVVPPPQRSRVETRLRSHTPSCRDARAWRWGTSCCTCAPRATSRATARAPSPCCVTAVGSGTAWCRPAGKVSAPGRAGPPPALAWRAEHVQTSPPSSGPGGMAPGVFLQHLQRRVATPELLIFGAGGNRE